MPRLFLTGGSGMVGQNIQAHESAKNWDILAPTSAELDLTDPKAVRTYIKMHKPDLVVHAAGPRNKRSLRRNDTATRLPGMYQRSSQGITRKKNQALDATADMSLVPQGEV